MPRYFFHLRSADKSLLDCDGMMFPGPEAARQEARQTIQDFFQPSTGRVAPEWNGWSMDLRDERGRCVFFMAFAEAPKLQDTPGEPTQPQASNVTHLDLARSRREFEITEKQTRELIRRAALLVDRNCYESKNLYHLMQVIGEARLRAEQLVARSRLQRASGC